MFLGLDVVVLGVPLLIAGLLVAGCRLSCLLVGGTLVVFGSLMVTPPLGPPAQALLVVYK